MKRHLTWAALALALLTTATGPAANAIADPAWVEPTVIDGIESVDDSQIQVDEHGNTYALMVTHVGALAQVIERTRPAGGSWQPAEPLSAPASEIPSAQLAVNGNGVQTAVWVERTSAGVPTLWATRRTPTLGWTTAQKLATLAAGERFGYLAVTENARGAALATWTHGQGIESSTYTDANGWSFPDVVVTGFAEFENSGATLDDEGGAHVVVNGYRSSASVWQIVAIDRPSAGSWSAPTLIAAPASHADNGIGVAWDAAGDAVVAWTAQETAGRPDLSTLYVASRPKGKAWSPPGMIGSGISPHSPVVAMNARGDTAVTWTSWLGPGSALVKASTRSASGSWTDWSAWDVAPLLVAAGDEPQSARLAITPTGTTRAFWHQPRTAVADAVFDVVEATHATAQSGWTLPVAVFPHAYLESLSFASSGDGAALIVDTPVGDTIGRITAVTYDATPPTLSGLSVPTNAVAGVPVSMSITGTDVLTGIHGVWDFGDATAPAAGSVPGNTSVAHAYAVPGTYTVTGSVADAADNRSSDRRTITINAASALTVNARPKRFRAATSGGSTAKRLPKGRGTTITVLTDGPAEVTLSVERASNGYRRGGKCVAAKPKRGKARRCDRLTRVPGHISQTIPSGTTAIVFTGRLKQHPLPAGSYRLTARAASGSVAGRSATTSFTVTR